MVSSAMKGTTKQELLVKHFKELIASGFYKPGDLIPPEMALAKEFAVNRMTVSKALTSLASAGVLVRKQGSGTYVSQAVAGAVPEARPQVRSTATTIAIVAFLDTSDPDYSRNPHTQVLSGAEDALAKLLPDARVTVANFQPETVVGANALARIPGPRPEGIIYLAFSGSKSIAEDMAAFQAGGPPVVGVSISDDAPDVDMVGIDQTSFGFLAADCLLRQGHRKLLYVIPEFDNEWLSRRIEGFKRALRGAGLEFSADMLLRHGTRLGVLPHEGRVEGRAVARRVLESGASGVMAVNDSYAVGMIEAFRQDGVDVPGQLSVVGADDDFHYRDQNLTTVRQPYREVGETAVEMLLGMMNNERRRLRHELWHVKPRLVERSSAAAPDAITPIGEI